MSSQKIIVFGVILSLVLGIFANGRLDFNLVKAEENQEESVEAPSASQREKMVDEYLKTPDNAISDEQKLVLTAVNGLSQTSQKIDFFWEGQPRLIMDPTDLAVLRAKVKGSASSRLVAADDSRITTDLYAAIKDENDANKISEAIDKAIAELSLDRIKNSLYQAKGYLEWSRDAGDEAAGLIQNGKELIFDLASSQNWLYEDPTEEKYRNYELDRRVVETLLYLVRPSSEGGAGHERIRVGRIWKDFEDPANPGFDEGAIEGVSRHNIGQALDIAEIDTVKCTLVKKKRLGKTKRIRQPAKPIKVAYQTKEGAAEADLPYGDTMNDAFKNLARGNLAGALEELGLVSEMDIKNLNSASSEDLSDFLGTSFAQSVLGEGKEIKGANMKAVIENLGAAFAEEALGIPRGTFTGGNLDEMLYNLGRRDAEEKLRLPASALKGKTGEEVLIQAGKRHLEDQLELPADSLPLNGTPSAALRLKAEETTKNYDSETVDRALGLPDNAFSLIFSQGDATNQYRQIGIKVIPERISTENAVRLAVSQYLKGGEAELPGYPLEKKFDSLGRFGFGANLSDSQAIQDETAAQTGACAGLGGKFKADEPKMSGEDQSATATYHCTKTFEEKDLPSSALVSALGLDAADFTRVFKGTGAEAVFRHSGRNIFFRRLKNSDKVEEKERQLLAEHPEAADAIGDIRFRQAALETAKSELKSAGDAAKAVVSSGLFQNSYQAADKSLADVLKKPSLRTIKAAKKQLSENLDKMDAGLDKDYGDEKKKAIKKHLESARYHLAAALTGEYQPLTPGEEAASPAGSTDDKNKYKALYDNNKGLVGIVKAVVNGDQSPLTAAAAYGGVEAAEKLKLPPSSFEFLTKGENREISGYPVTEISHNNPTDYERWLDSRTDWHSSQCQTLGGTDPTVKLIKTEKQGGNSQKSFVEFHCANPKRAEEAKKTESEKFYEAIGKARLREAFPASDDLATIFQGNPPNAIDQQLGLYAGESQKYGSGEINKDEYYRKIGRASLKKTGASELAKQKLQVSDYFFTPDDYFQMLSGNTNRIFDRIAGAKLDKELHLSPGRGETLFTALSGKDDDARQLALSQVGADWLGDLLDMPAFDLTGNIPRNLAGRRLEKTLGLLPGSVKEKGAAADLLKKNGPLAFARAFRIPLPFDPGYGYEQYIADIEKSFQESKNDQDAIEISGAEARINSFEAKLNDRIGQIRDSYWDPRAFTDYGMNKTEEAPLIQKFWEDMSLLDALLYAPKGTLLNYLQGKYDNEKLLNEIAGNNGARNKDYIIRNSGAIEDLIGNLADKLGLEADTAYRSLFVGNAVDFLSAVAVRSPNDASQTPDSSLKSWAINMLAPIIDQKIGINYAADENGAIDINGGSAGLLTGKLNTKRFLSEQGMRYLEKNYFNFENGQLVNYFKANQGANDCPIRGGFAANTGCALLTGELRKQLSGISHGKINLQEYSAQNPNGLKGSELDMILAGDTRVITLVAGAGLLYNSGFFEKEEGSSPISVPSQIIPTLDDFRAAVFGKGTDRTVVDSYVNQELAKIYEQANFTDDLPLVEEQKQIISNGLAWEKEAELRKSHQKNLQYKLMDSQLWKLDSHIPAGFAQAFSEGDENGKAASLAGLGLNYINDDTLLGTIFKNDIKVRDAAIAYIQDPSNEAAKQISLSGFTALEGLMNQNKIFGDIKIENGTLLSVYRGVFKNGTPQSLEIMTKELASLYKTQWQTFAFSLADGKLGLPAGTAYQMYSMYQGYQKALSAMKGAENFAVSADEVVGAQENLKAAKDAIVQFAVNFAVQKLFGEQLARVDEQIGLVPGSMAMLVATAITYQMGALGSAGLMIAAVMFVLTNLFGVYKVKLVCTADGYYPGLESAPIDPALNLGLGVFDGKNAETYRAGIMRAAKEKVDGLVSDMLNFGYHYENGKEFRALQYDKPDELTKPIQILTFRQETLDKFFGTSLYREVFNDDPPSAQNRQGIGVTDKMPRQVHIGF